jgi:hypothetical protein
MWDTQGFPSFPTRLGIQGFVRATTGFPKGFREKKSLRFQPWIPAFAGMTPSFGNSAKLFH